MSTERQRVVLVTGAAGGIGAATARTLAAEGAAVVVHDVRREGGSTHLPASWATQRHALEADLRDPAAADALWQEAARLARPRRRHS